MAGCHPSRSLAIHTANTAAATACAAKTAADMVAVDGEEETGGSNNRDGRQVP